MDNVNVLIRNIDHFDQTLNDMEQQWNDFIVENQIWCEVYDNFIANLITSYT